MATDQPLCYWRKVTDLVSQNYRVVSIDLLGFGQSPKPRKSNYDYDAHIASIKRTLWAAGVSEPFILVGHSMGALLSLRFATLYEDKVSKLVLTNMPVMIGSRQVKEHIFKPNIIYRLGLSPVSHRMMWAILKVLYRLKLLPRRSALLLSSNIEYVFKHSPLSRLKSFRSVIMQAKTEVDLAAVTVKTTILSGIDDKMIYIHNLAHNINLGPHVVVKNYRTGHHIPLVMPEILAQTISD